MLFWEDEMLQEELAEGRYAIDAYHPACHIVAHTVTNH
jgi:hypothetical protein